MAIIASFIFPIVFVQILGVLKGSISYHKLYQVYLQTNFLSNIFIDAHRHLEMSTQAFDLHSVYDFKKGSLTSDTFF